MIKKYSSRNLVELDFYFELIKKAQSSPEQWQQALDYMKSAEPKIMAYSSAFQQAADKISTAHQKLERAGVTTDDIQKAIGESSAAGVQQPESVRQASGLKNKIRELKKFSRMYRSIKGEENKFKFLKKSGVVNEEALVKLGMRLEADKLIKSGSIDKGSLLLKIATQENLALDDAYKAALQQAIKDAPDLNAARNLARNLGLNVSEVGRGGRALTESQLTERYNHAIARARTTPRIPSAATPPATPPAPSAAPPATPPAVPPMTPVEASQYIGREWSIPRTDGSTTMATLRNINTQTGEATFTWKNPQTDQMMEKTLTNEQFLRATGRGAAPVDATPGASSRFFRNTPGTQGGRALFQPETPIPSTGQGAAPIAAGVADDAAAATSGGGWWSRIKGLGGSAMNWIQTSQNFFAKGLRFLGKVFKWLGVIIEVIRGMIGLWNAFKGIAQVMGVAEQVGLDTWTVLYSSKSISDKIPEFQNNPEKLGQLAYVAEGAATFYRGIVDVILSPIFAALQYGVVLAGIAAGTAAAPTGPFAPLIGIAVGAGLGIATEWLRGWISSALSDYATSGYVAVSNNITNIIKNNIAPPQEFPTQLPSEGGGAGGAEVGTSFAPEEEIPPTQRTTRRTAPPVTTPQESPMSPRDLRRERRLGRRQERKERRSLRRSERAARRAARRGLASTGASERIIQFIKLANSLDDQDLVEEADMIDNLLSQLA